MWASVWAGHLRKELKDEHIQCRVVPVNVAERSSQPKRFKNLRAQIWWEVGREGINDGLICLTDIDDETLSQLVAPKWSRKRDRSNRGGTQGRHHRQNRAIT